MPGGSEGGRGPAVKHETSASPAGGAVLVVGAGWLGSAAALDLARRGNDVIATTRTGVARAGVAAHPRVHYESYDAQRDGVSRLAELVEEARVALICWAPAGRDIDRRRHYVEGAERIVTALRGQRLDRLVYTSSTSALPSIDEELDETCETWPESARGRIQREAEEVIARGAREREIPWTILRLAGLYGPGRELDRIYRWEEGAVLGGDGASPTNLVHIEDVCAAIAASLRLPATSSGVIHVCDDDHATRREWFARVALRKGRSHPAWELPEAPPRGKRVSNRRMKESLGVALRYPLRMESAEGSPSQRE